MTSSDLTASLAALRAIAERHDGLELLVLHGSRGRGQARDDSDWDFAYLAAPTCDPSLLHADLVMALGTDDVDLIDLATTGGLIRYRVARDGLPVFEASPALFDRFWFEAVSFWCDAEHVLRAGYQAVLDELRP